MENKLRAYMDHLFQDVPNTKKAVEVKAAKKRAEKSAERKETGDYTLSVTGTF